MSLESGGSPGRQGPGVLYVLSSLGLTKGTGCQGGSPVLEDWDAFDAEASGRRGSSPPNEGATRIAVKARLNAYMMNTRCIRNGRISGELEEKACNRRDCSR